MLTFHQPAIARAHHNSKVNEEEGQSAEVERHRESQGNLSPSRDSLPTRTVDVDTLSSTTRRGSIAEGNGLPSQALSTDKQRTPSLEDVYDDGEYAIAAPAGKPISSIPSVPSFSTTPSLASFHTPSKPSRSPDVTSNEQSGTVLTGSASALSVEPWACQLTRWSVWDGYQVWVGGNVLAPATQELICQQTVAGENSTEEFRDLTIYMDEGCVAFAVSFSLPEAYVSTDVVLSVALVFTVDNSTFDESVDVVGVITKPAEDSVRQLGLILKELVVNKKSNIHLISLHPGFPLLPFVTVLHVYPVQDWEQAIEQLSTAIESHMKTLSKLFSCSVPPFRFSETIFWRSYPREDFLGAAITSHLQTLNSSLVIGSSREDVQRFVNTLCLFLTPEQRACSAGIVEEYCPNLFLQGLLLAPHQNANGVSTGIESTVGPIHESLLLQNMLPTTVVDLNNYVILQSRPFNEYCHLRACYVADRVNSIVNGDGASSGYGFDLFRLNVQCAPIVRQVLREMYSLPAPIREGYLSHRLSMMFYRAATIVRRLQGSDAEQSHSSLLEQLMADLDINSVEDLSVFLAMAEFLSPGSYKAVRGDPAKRSEIVLEAFDSFV